MSNDERKTTVEGSVNTGFIYVGGDFIGRDKYEEQHHHYYPPPEPTAPKFLLPKPPANFTGRATALEWLRENLYPGRVLTIHGPGGLGKTAVTNHCLNQLDQSGELQKRFPHGLIFHTFYHQPRTEQAYLTILEGVGLEPPNKLEEMERLVRQVLQSQRLLLVLDGAEEAADLEGILKLQGRAGVLISSRKREDVYGEGHELELFPNEEAVQLLHKIAGRLAQPTPAAQELCKLVANLPLAVQLVGRFLYMRQEPAAEYVNWFKQAQLRQVHLKTGRENSLPLFYQRTFDQLVPEMQEVLKLFRYLAFAPVPPAALQAALGVEERPLKEWVQELVNYSLLERLENGRVQPIHALIYQWVQESVSVEVEVLTRLAEYWTEQSKVAEEQMAEEFAMLYDLAPHWLELAHMASQQNLPQLAYDLIEGVDWYLYLQTHSGEHLQFRLLSVQIAEQLNTLHNQAYALHRLGEIYHRCSDYQLAIECYNQAIPLYLEQADKLGEAHCIQALGNVYLRTSNYPLAREKYEEVRLIYDQIGARLEEVNIIRSLGNVHLRLSEYPQAQERYLEAMFRYIQTDNRLGEAHCIRKLADIHLELLECSQARERYKKAQFIYAQVGDRLGEAHCTRKLGDIYLVEAEYPLAQKQYEEAYLIYLQIGDRVGEITSLRSLGDVHRMVDEYPLAREKYERAKNLYNQIGDKLGEAKCYQNLGQLYQAEQQFEWADKMYHQALSIYQAIGARYYVAWTTAYLGYLARDRGNRTKAWVLLAQAIEQLTTISPSGAERLKPALKALDGE